MDHPRISRSKTNKPTLLNVDNEKPDSFSCLFLPFFDVLFNAPDFCEVKQHSKVVENDVNLTYTRPLILFDGIVNLSLKRSTFRVLREQSFHFVNSIPTTSQTSGIGVFPLTLTSLKGCSVFIFSSISSNPFNPCFSARSFTISCFSWRCSSDSSPSCWLVART